MPIVEVMMPRKSAQSDRRGKCSCGCTNDEARGNRWCRLNARAARDPSLLVTCDLELSCARARLRQV